ncbi:hypothetical protein AB0B12_37050 [Streptomyces sp. NPDC044780]|uniref:Small hydrophilic protein n=1 Tax=Streptomyces luomodiensis TaxID=3026192 RepID=A0ABY9UUA0_9ACTN|nr:MULTISPECIES: hypothetical protein [unclassified Streptomyces]WAP55494.1 hypothetical protein N6H00_11165 [Streptomyces sp. S465]WNE96016.1 hypothetical protein PS467_12065 [Streptomyces sp. SCA4-21]
MGKNKNRTRKQQQEQGMADRPAEQQSSMDAQSQAMRSEGSPSTARKTRQKSFGHN